MRITLLSDNNTLIDRYFLGEPGFSAYIEDEGTGILFDVGYAGIFLANAQKMRIDLAEIDYVALSHGHLDHTWGLDALIRFYAEMDFEGIPHKAPTLIAHPETFTSVADEVSREIGPLLSERKLEKHFSVCLTQEPQWLTARCVYLGSVPRKNDFEGNLVFGRKEGEADGDIVKDDTALVYKGTEGLVIITGCSHSGICNILDYAQEVCGERRIRDVIGGFHLQDPTERHLRGTLDYFRSQDIREAHPCHCTDLRSKIALSTVVPVVETGVGARLDFS